MISRDEVFAMKGVFWKSLRASIAEGLRDVKTGFDRLAYDRLDPRVEGGETLSFALCRALAQIWRTGEGVEPMAACVFVGTVQGGMLKVRELPLEEWPTFENIHIASDGLANLTSAQTVTRRIRVDDGREGMDQLFGIADLPGDVVLAMGLLSNPDERLMREVAKQANAGRNGVAVVFLYQPNAGPIDIGDSGGPMRNCFHPGLAASHAMSNSHLSANYLRLMQVEEKENWYDADLRKQLMEGLVAGAAQRGLEVTKRGFLDALAEGSPLRRVLPAHLTRYFPEAERLFWCLQDGIYDDIDPAVWDESSPMERLALLQELKQSDGYAQ